jgi:hypothetical protein
MKKNWISGALYLLILCVIAPTGCASRSDKVTLRKGVRYTTVLGNGMDVEIKADDKTGSIYVWITRGDDAVADFGVLDDWINSKIMVNAERGESIHVDVKNGKLVHHCLLKSDDKIYERIEDRDGDFFPDERIISDKIAQKRTRQTVTHTFWPDTEKK